MEQELIFGTYLFFLLCGVGMGLLVGYIVGYQTAADSAGLDDSDQADIPEGRRDHGGQL
jgi:hypothetical protein